MKYREKYISTRLSGAAVVSIAASLFVSNIALAQTAPKIETVVTLGQDTNGQVENLAEGPDGAIYATAAFDRVLWRVKDGKAEKFFSAPKYAVMSGVYWDRNDLVVSVLDKSPFPARGAGPAPGQGAPGQGQAAPGQGGQRAGGGAEGQRAGGGGDGQRAGGGGGGFQLNRDIGPHSLILDRSGKVKATVDGENSSFFNGLARAGDNWFLITDSAGGGLISLDTKTKTLTQWFIDPMIRPNGIKVNNGWVYLVSNGNVYRIKIGPDKKPMGGAVVFAMGAQTDDFGVAPDGTVYIPSGKTMVKVSPTGERSVFLEDIETTNSPAAYVTKDGKWLYWTERAGPAKIKRVALK